MSEFDPAVQSILDDAMARGPARKPATLGEIWRSEWASSGLSTFSGVGEPMSHAYHDLVSGITSAAGQSLADLTAARGIDLDRASSLDEKISLLGGIVDTLPDQQANKLQGLRDVRRRAAQLAADREREAQETYGSRRGVAGWAASVAAGMARQVVDPTNLATMPLGGPLLKGPLLRVVGRELALNAGVQAVQEPFIQSGRADLGLEAGFGQAISNIAQAGFGAAGLTVFGRGVASLFHAAATRAGYRGIDGYEGFWGKDSKLAATLRDGMEKAASAARSRFGRVSEPELPLSGGDFNALAQRAERDAALDASVWPPSRRGQMETMQAVDRAAAAIDAGQPMPEFRRMTEGPAVDWMGPQTSAPRFADGFEPRRAVYFDGDTAPIIRPDGSRLMTRPVVMELSDLVASHGVDGNVNPAFPAEMQPRDRSSAASVAWISETARKLEPELLGRASKTATEGAPVIGPDGIVESGNGRVLALARAYDRVPERADAYRSFLTDQGYDLDGFEFPVLVRMREGEVGSRAAFAREANVSQTAGLSVSELAFADARKLDEALLSAYAGGDVAALGNVPFARAFAAQVVAPAERPNFVTLDNRLSADGVRRIEAAMVARAWGEKDIVAALYDAADPTSKAILGAMADTAPVVARLKAAVQEGRVPASADPTAALIDAYRLVDRARQSGQSVRVLADQIDIERGAVPDEVRAALATYFRDDKLDQAAARPTVAARIDAVVDRALMQQDAVGDLFGARLDTAQNLRSAAKVGVELEDVSVSPARDLTNPGIARRAAYAPEEWEPVWRAMRAAQPFDTIDELYRRAPAHQEELAAAVQRMIADIPGVELKNPGVKERATAAEKMLRKDYNSPRELTDIVRLGVVVDAPAAADSLVTALSGRWRVIDEGWNTTDVGYFDRKLIVRLDDGLLAEVQLWPAAMLAAKKEGHKLYEMRRVETDTARRAALLDEEKAYWENIQAALPEVWAAVKTGHPNLSSSAANILSASPREISRPSSVTSASLTDRQPFSGLSTSPSREVMTPASRLSQLNQRMSGIDAPPVEPARIIGAPSPPAKPTRAIDPALHGEIDAILNEFGGDFELRIIDTVDGAATERKVSVRQFLAEADDQAAAAAELLHCAGGAPEAS